MVEPPIVIVQPADQRQLAFLGRGLTSPRIHNLVRHLTVKTAVRATVERHKQQGTGLRSFHRQEHTAHRGEQTSELFLNSAAF